MENLKNIVRDVPDFPKPGILFKDIAPLLQKKESFQQTIDAIAAQWTGQQIDVVAGIEARGVFVCRCACLQIQRRCGDDQKTRQTPI